TLGSAVWGAVHDTGEALPRYAIIIAIVTPLWLVQACVAAVVGMQTLRLPVLHGLCAACVSAVGACGGVEGFWAMRTRQMLAADPFVLLFVMIAHGGVLPALLTAWLAARLSALERTRRTGTAWGLAPGMSTPAGLPRWHWGAVCLPWLWAL